MRSADSLEQQPWDQLHALPRQLPSQWRSVVQAWALAISAQCGGQWGGPLTGSFAPLPVGWPKSWHDLLCGLRCSLPYFPPSSFLSQDHVLHPEGFSCPVLPLPPFSSAVIASHPPQVLIPHSSICFLKDPDQHRWRLLRISVHLSEILLSLWKAKLRISRLSNVQHTTNVGLNTEQRSVRIVYFLSIFLNQITFCLNIWDVQNSRIVCNRRSTNERLETKENGSCTPNTNKDEQITLKHKGNYWKPDWLPSRSTGCE